MQVRGSYSSLQNNPVQAALAQRDDRKLTAALTERYGLTSTELTTQVNTLVQTVAPQAPRPDPFAANFAAQEAVLDDRPAYNERVNESPMGQLVKREFEGKARMLASTLEPLQYLKDVAGVAIKADAESIDMPVGQKLAYIGQAIAGDVEHSAYFDQINPKVYWGVGGRENDAPAKNYNDEENIRMFARALNVEDDIPDSAFKVAGILSELFIDPLIFGEAIKTVGLLAKAPEYAAMIRASRTSKVAAQLGRAGDTAGEAALRGLAGADTSNAVTRAMSRGGNNLVKLGNQINEVLSPQNVVRAGAKGVGRVIPESVKKAIGTRFEDSFARILNAGQTSLEYGVGENAVEYSNARLVAPGGEMFWNRGKTFLTGEANYAEIQAAREAGVYNAMTPNREARAAIKAYSGRGANGTATPFEMRDSLARGEYAADTAVAGLERGLGNIFSTLGSDKGKAWVKGTHDILRKYGQMADNPELRRYDTELTDTLMTMALDTVKNTGVAQRPGALAKLDEVSQANMSARTFVAGNASFKNTIGAELRDQLTGAPETMSLVDRENAERVVRLAAKKGIDPKEALKAYDSIVDETIALDVQLGYHNSMVAPLKDAFFTEVAQRGGGFTEANDLWKAMTAASMRGENAMSIPITSDLRLSQPLGAKAQAVGKETAAAQNARLTAGLTDEQIAMGAGKEAIDAYEGGEQAMTTGTLMNRLSSGLGVDFNSYFRDLNQGHFRNSYAAFQQKRNPEKLIKALQQGDVFRSPVLDKDLYDGPLRKAGFGREADLIASYVDNIAPNRRGERGILVKQTSILNHLLDSGVEPRQAKLAVSKLSATLAPENLKEAADGTQIVTNYIRNKAGQTQTGYGIGKQRNVTAAPKATAFNETGNVSEKGVVELSGITVDRETYDAAMDEYENVASYLGQIIDPVTSLGEAAEYTKRHYPARQFVLDTYTLANREGYVKPLTKGKQLDDIPEGWVKIPASDKKFGPFAGTIVQGYLARELKSALLNDSAGRLNGLGRFQSAVTAGFIASPDSIVNNFIGGVYSSHLYGTNPVELIAEWGKVMEDIKALPEGKNLPDYDEVGHLLGSQTKALKFAQAIGDRKMDLSGFGTPGWKQKVEDTLKSQLQAPLGQSWAGLDGFQAVEDTLKIANYRAALKMFDGDKAKAVEYARNVLFDYQSLPESARFLRDKGMLTFPGFPLFMTSRTIGAVANKPGIVGTYDRIPGVAWENMTEDDDELYAATAMLDNSYQLDSRAVPISKAEGEFGSIFKTFPLYSWLPTNILEKANLGDPVSENLAGFGIGRALVDAGVAWGPGQGQATFGAKYGQQVFDPGASTPVKVGQTAAFIGQSYSPSILKSIVTYNPGKVREGDSLSQKSPWGGVALGVARSAVDVAAPQYRNLIEASGLPSDSPLYRYLDRNVAPLSAAGAERLRKAQEVNNDRAERTRFDELTSVVLPTTTPLSLDVRTSNKDRKATRYQFDREKQVGRMQKTINEEKQSLVAAEGDNADWTRENLVRLIKKQADAGKKEVTMPDGTVTMITPELLESIAMGNYWNNYNK